MDERQQEGIVESDSESATEYGTDYPAPRQRRRDGSNLAIMRRLAASSERVITKLLYQMLDIDDEVVKHYISAFVRRSIREGTFRRLRPASAQIVHVWEQRCIVFVYEDLHAESIELPY